MQILAEVLKEEPGAAIALSLTRADGSTVTEELPFAGARRSSGDALAVLHAMRCPKPSTPEPGRL